MKFRIIPTVLAATSLTLSLAACSGAPATDSGVGGEDLTTLKVGVMSINSNAALLLGDEKGFFEEEGLKIETTAIANPPAGIAAAQSGQMDLTYATSIPLLNALSQSVPLKVIAPADGYPDDVLEMSNPAEVDDTGLFVAADSDIDSPADLQGRTVAVPARKAQLEVNIASLIRNDGGDPSKVNWMVLDPASALQTLQQGQVDAAGLISPFMTQAKEAGARLLASPGVQFFGGGVVGSWVAGHSTVDQKPEALAAFKRAVEKANAYAQDHMDEAQQVASKLTSVELETVKAGPKSYWPTNVEIEDFQTVNEKLVELGYLPKEVPLDDSLIFTTK